MRLRDDAELRRFGIAPSISFGLNSQTRATLSYEHLTESDTPDYGLPWLFNQLAPGVNRSSYFGFPEAEAERLMLQVHNDGRAVVATGTREEMERHVEAMHDYGLWATLTKADA